MEETEILKHLVRRETELERKRVTALARQMWAKVLDFESRLDEVRTLRAWIASEAYKEPPVRVA